MILQDVTYRRGKFGISGRYALFDTEDYDNRIYVYERDAWLSFTFPMYYGKGIRNYLLLQYRMTSRVDVWLRWSTTHYINQGSIGSGGEMIVGDRRNDVKLQARIRF